MGIIEWNENFLTGYFDIDNQHKKIFKFLKNIYEYNKINPESQEILQKIHSFLLFMEQHLEFEETLINKYNIKDGEEHKKEHTYFREKIKEILKLYETSPYALTFELCKFINDFYSSHIVFYDKILVKEIKKKSMEEV